MTGSKRAVIFLNGNLSKAQNVAAYITKDTLIIGSDGGADLARTLGYTPQVILGDFDSLEQVPEQVRRQKSGQPLLLHGTTFVRYSEEKDCTDTELAVRWALAVGCSDIFLTGLLGDRVDHILGTLYLLTKPAFTGARLTIIEGAQELYLIQDNANITGTVGDIISFMPVSGTARATSGEGLKYPLGKYDLSMQGNQGLSNVLTRKRVHIIVTEGQLLVIHEKRPTTA